MLSIADFAHVQDGRLRLILGHWLALRGAHALPRRGDIDPAAIATALPYVAIYQRAPGPAAFRCRLAGEEVNAFYGRSIRGLPIAEFLPATALPVFRSLLTAVIGDRVVIHGAGRFLFDDSGFGLPGERLLMPLSDDGATANAIFHGLIAGCAFTGHRRAPMVGVDLVDTITPTDQALADERTVSTRRQVGYVPVAPATRR